MRFFSVFVALSLLCSAYAEELSPVTHVVSFTEMDAEQSTALLMGQLPDLAIECKAGTQLPLRYLGDFNLFSIHYAPNLKVKIDRTFYFRFVNNRGYISFDLQEWEKASQFFAGKRARPKIEVNKSEISVEVRLEDNFNQLDFEDEES